MSADDHEAWSYWRRVALVHASTKRFARKVADAKRIVTRWLDACESPAVAWSGGKDSSVLVHLACCEMGARGVAVFSEKDDLDYPGEEEYVCRLAAKWSLDLTVLRPPVSPMQWLVDHRHELSADTEMRARSSGLSKACFYNVVDAHNARHDGLAMGLRAEESEQRRKMRARLGGLYMTKAGQLRALPLIDWTGQDVLAYAHSREVELLPVYRCIALMHSREPWRIRKSWWLPTSHAARYGAVAWLKRYYPSLFDKFRDLFWDADRHT